jgi:outer membrane lipoprotein-sorting protein
MRLFFLALAALAASPLRAETLDGLLKRMASAASGFHAMTAALKKTAYTAVINDLSEESGMMTVLRLKAKDTRMLVEFTRPDPRAVAFAGRKVQIFYPKINTVQEYDLGKQGKLVDQFLLLGFGATGSDLRTTYSIQWAGEENLAGQKTYRLDLTPKNKEAAEHVRHIELWISDANAQPAQEKVWQGAKDYTLISYSDVKLNPNIKEDALRLKMPADVKKEYPQK